MAPPLGALLAATKAGFDLLLIGHVACAVLGFGALGLSGVQAFRLSQVEPGDTAQALRRYFAPGFNWAGRVIYGVPVFGFLLLAQSGGHLRLGEDWVLAGLVLWALAGAAAEAFLWPAERRIQSAVAGTPPGRLGALSPPVIRDCRMVGSLGAAVAVAFVVATVLMVARPG
jgi:uncharacterized membrane protein